MTADDPTFRGIRMVDYLNLKRFAPRLVLTDTGERRFPRPGEWYCVQANPTAVYGPTYHVDDDNDWDLPSERYAIYALTEPEDADV
jgi:hypothetical protein